jgi:hypothetical protein
MAEMLAGTPDPISRFIFIELYVEYESEKPTTPCSSHLMCADTFDCIGLKNHKNHGGERSIQAY